MATFFCPVINSLKMCWSIQSRSFVFLVPKRIPSILPEIICDIWVSNIFIILSVKFVIIIIIMNNNNSNNNNNNNKGEIYISIKEKERKTDWQYTTVFRPSSPDATLYKNSLLTHFSAYASKMELSNFVLPSIYIHMLNLTFDRIIIAWVGVVKHLFGGAQLLTTETWGKQFEVI